MPSNCRRIRRWNSAKSSKWYFRFLNIFILNVLRFLDFVPTLFIPIRRPQLLHSDQLTGLLGVLFRIRHLRTFTYQNLIGLLMTIKQFHWFLLFCSRRISSITHNYYSQTILFANSKREITSSRRLKYDFRRTGVNVWCRQNPNYLYWMRDGRTIVNVKLLRVRLQCNCHIERRKHTSLSLSLLLSLILNAIVIVKFAVKTNHFNFLILIFWIALFGISLLFPI